MENRGRNEIGEEDLDIDLLKQEVEKDPRHKKIFLGLWKVIEELRMWGNLQEMVDVIREIRRQLIANMHKEWERCSGYPMTIEQEKMVFGTPKNQVKLAMVDKMMDFIEHMYKANQIAMLFGLDSVAPIALNKMASGCWKGGDETAKLYKGQKEKLREEYQTLFDEKKKMRPKKWSVHAIEKEVAKTVHKSVSHVHQVRTGYVRRKKK